MRPRLRLLGYGTRPPASDAGPTAEDLLAHQRRIAVELHATLAQELALIVTYASTLSAGGEAEFAVAELRDAAQRALDASRRVIQLLQDPPAGDSGSARDRPESGTFATAVRVLGGVEATSLLPQ